MKQGRQKAEGRGQKSDRVIPPTTGRARHQVRHSLGDDGSVRAVDQPQRTNKLQTRDAIPPLLGERAGVRGITAPTSAIGVTYILNKSILEKIWLERLRQKQLLREGRIFFACDSPVVSHDRKLRVLTEELGEVAGAIDRIENLNPLRQPRAALSEPSARAQKHLRDELTQIAAVAIAWLESLQNAALPDGGYVRGTGRSVQPATTASDNSHAQFVGGPLRLGFATAAVRRPGEYAVPRRPRRRLETPAADLPGPQL